MSISDVLKAGDWKKVVKSVYDEYVYPALKAYVEKTDNSWDDTALTFVDQFLDDWLAE